MIAKLLATAVLVAGLAACSAAARTPARTVTVVAPARSSVAPAPSVSPTPTPTPVARTLPGTCLTLLPIWDVDRVIGRPTVGRTAFVVGVPEKRIGRLSYLNCRYGLPITSHSTDHPPVELGISLYATPQDAARRALQTVWDYRDNGAHRASIPLAGGTGTPLTGTPLTGTLLTGGRGADYATPLLVVAAGQRTIAVSLSSSLGTPSWRRTAMAALARLCLRRTAV